MTPELYTAAYQLLTEDGQPYPPTERPLARAVLRGETVLDARSCATSSLRPPTVSSRRRVPRASSARSWHAALRRYVAMKVPRCIVADVASQVITGYTIINPHARGVAKSVASREIASVVGFDTALGEASSACASARRRARIAVTFLDPTTRRPITRQRNACLGGRLSGAQLHSSYQSTVALVALTVCARPPVPTSMHLADFLDAHATEILVDWVRFAETLPSAEGLPVNALRDHAGEMLQAIAHTVRTQRTTAEAEGGAAPISPELRGPAAAHGADRATHGFSITEIVAEFRALRARVVRLWTAEGGARTSVDHDDVARFHAAIDQAVADSVVRYHAGVRDAQELFIAMFGHDLRTPLSTVTVVIEHLAQAASADPAQARLLARAARSTKRMTHMLDDLLDFTRTRAGAGVEVHPRDIDLHRVIDDAVDEARSLGGHHTFVIDQHGDLRGAFDAARLGQVLANLLGNACQHGAVEIPIRVVARGDREDAVTVAVCNGGAPIEPSDLPTLFSPYKRLQPGRTSGRDGAHLGLGLYITEQIVAAHGGEITVTSTDADGTCFTARLPRNHRARARSN